MVPFREGRAHLNSEKGRPHGYTNLTPANIAAANALAIRLNELESRLVMRDALASDA